MSENRLLPISVVIPTLNRSKALEGTIDSLLSGEYAPNEIIVVDQSEEIFSLKHHPEWVSIVRVYKEDMPSLTRARNVGVRFASNDIVLFSDDDIEVNKDTIKRLFIEMSRDDVALVSTVDCKGNTLYDYKEKRYKKLSNFVGCICGNRLPGQSGGYIVKWSIKGRYADGMTKPQTTEWAFGFFFCVRKSLMEQWNVWFDEKMVKYAYAEDLDFSCRYCRCAKQVGLKTIVNPELYVHHLVSNEWRTPSQDTILFFFVNRWYLSYKLFSGEWWYRIGMVWSDFWYTALVLRGKQKLIGYGAMRKTYKLRKSLKNGIIKI